MELRIRHGLFGRDAKLPLHEAAVVEVATEHDPAGFHFLPGTGLRVAKAVLLERGRKRDRRVIRENLGLDEGDLTH